MRHIRGQDHVAERLKAARRMSVNKKIKTGIKNGSCCLLPIIGLILIGIAGLFYSSFLISLFDFHSNAFEISTDFWGIFMLGVVSLVFFSAVKAMVNYFTGANDDELVARLEAGYQGEKAVVDALKGLDHRWVLFSGVVVEGVFGDIDHVLIGPAGVFAIEAKNWSGTIWYDDASGLWHRKNRHHPAGEVVKDPVRQIVRATRALQKVLKGRVVPLVVFVGQDTHCTYDHPTVQVLALSNLVPWLRSQTNRLNEATVDRVARRLKQMMR